MATEEVRLNVDQVVSPHVSYGIDPDKRCVESAVAHAEESHLADAFANEYLESISANRFISLIPAVPSNRSCPDAVRVEHSIVGSIDPVRPLRAERSRQIKAVSRGVAFLLRWDMAENLSRKNH